MSSLNRAHVVLSPVTAVGSAVTVDSNQNLKEDMPSSTVSVRYYSDENGTLAVPGAGTVTISATSLVTNQDTPVTNGVLDATDVTAYVEWEHLCTKITALPAGINTATHYQLVVVQGL